MKTVIAGSRTIRDYDVLEKAIQKSGFRITEVVSGMAKGVDSLGLLWAKKHKIPVSEFHANWEEYGKSAGMIRNAEMAEYADCAIVIHTNSKGSLNMVERMRKLGKDVFEVILKEQMEIEL